MSSVVDAPVTGVERRWTIDKFWVVAHHPDGIKQDIECAVRQVQANPHAPKKPLVVEGYSDDLEGVGNDVRFVVPANDVNLRGHQVLRVGRWVTLVHPVDSTPNADQPWVLSNTEALFEKLYSHIARPQVKPTTEWSSDVGDIKIVGANEIGGGMVSVPNSHAINPLGQANAKPGLSVWERTELAKTWAWGVAQAAGFKEG
jgi:hypothetical protein